MRQRFCTKIMSAKSALATLSTILTQADLVGCSIVAFYIVANDATVSAGAVQIEDCHDPTGAFAGTWAAQGSAVTPVQNAAKKVTIANDAFGSLRARISTGVTGGATVDVWAVGRG